MVGPDRRCRLPVTILAFDSCAAGDGASGCLAVPGGNLGDGIGSAGKRLMRLSAVNRPLIFITLSNCSRLLLAENDDGVVCPLPTVDRGRRLGGSFTLIRESAVAPAQTLGVERKLSMADACRCRWNRTVASLMAFQVPLLTTERGRVVGGQ